MKKLLSLLIILMITLVGCSKGGLEKDEGSGKEVDIHEREGDKDEHEGDKDKDEGESDQVVDLNEIGLNLDEYMIDHKEWVAEAGVDYELSRLEVVEEYEEEGYKVFILDGYLVREDAGLSGGVIGAVILDSNGDYLRRERDNAPHGAYFFKEEADQDFVKGFVSTLLQKALFEY